VKREWFYVIFLISWLSYISAALILFGKIINRLSRLAGTVCDLQNQKSVFFVHLHDVVMLAKAALRQIKTIIQTFAYFSDCKFFMIVKKKLTSKFPDLRTHFMEQIMMTERTIIRPTPANKNRISHFHV
jgi:hypothetical protein